MQAAKVLPEQNQCVLVICGDTPLLRAETIQQLIKQHQEKKMQSPY